ncbi:hypothetical protein KI387_009180, partial [Taxus chinensis]
MHVPRKGREEEFLHGKPRIAIGEVAGLFLTAIKRRSFEENHSPMKAQEHGESVKQASSKEE